LPESLGFTGEVCTEYGAKNPPIDEANCANHSILRFAAAEHPLKVGKSKRFPFRDPFLGNAVEKWVQNTHFELCQVPEHIENFDWRLWTPGQNIARRRTTVRSPVMPRGEFILKIDPIYNQERFLKCPATSIRSF
jgi:hypothetical protein